MLEGSGVESGSTRTLLWDMSPEKLSRDVDICVSPQKYAQLPT